MTPFLRAASMSFCMALATTSAIGFIATADQAHAQEDDKRRVLKARQLEATDDTSEEYRKAAERKRIESIDFLKDLLSQGDAEGDRKAEMMLRLADLYFQQGRSIYLREMEAFDKVFEKCFNTEGCDTESMQADNSKSHDWQSKSIRLYQQILRNYARYNRADEATFYLGMALQDLGRREEALKSFSKLVKFYPDSGYVPDAYVNIGEYYFDTNNAYKALLAYKKATAYRDSSKYSFALYKLAWCYYNVGEYGKGIDTMKSVVAYTQTQSGNDKMQLQDEALKDLVRFFADAGEMDEAYAYFNKLGKKELIRSMLKRLANMYFEQGKFEQTIQTYRRLISENPQSPDNPGYQHEIIKAYKRIGKKQETLQEVDRLLKTYGKNSAWARANASDQDAVKKASASIEKNLRQVAVEYHNQARKLGSGASAIETYALAERAYSVYLQEFPNSSHLYEVRYAYGELLYKLKKYDMAYEQYMAVVKLDPKGKHSRFCAESAIFASDEIVKKETKEAKAAGTAPATDDKTPQELTTWEGNLITACRQYAELYPEDKKVRNIIYKSAYLLYHKYRFEEAGEQFKVVIKMDPSSKEAMQGANLILDAFVINKDWKNLKSNSKFYYEQEGLGTSKFKTEVYNIYQRASFQVIETGFEKDQDKGKAADGYMAFYAEFSTTAELEVLAKALNNSAFYYREIGKIARSTEVRHIMVEDEQFGEKLSKLKKGWNYYYGQIAALGFDYETIADFKTAAKYYEMLFELYPSELARIKLLKDGGAEYAAEMPAAAADAIYSAAVFRKALGEFDKSVENYRQFLATFPKDERAFDVMLTIANVFEEQELWNEAANQYSAFYKDEGRAAEAQFRYFARLRHAKALELMDQQKKADAVYKETVALYKKEFKEGSETGPQTEYVAEMMYILAQPTLDKFRDMGLTSLGKGKGRKTEDRHMKKQLVGKNEALKGVAQTYGEIIGSGSGPWGLAALVQLGKAQENMAETLLTGDLPYYLDSDQAEYYRMGMQDMAYPKTEDAVNWYTQAINKAYELTLYNEHTAYAVRRLGELRPDDFPGLEEDIPTGEYTSSKARTYDFESEL